MDLIEDKIYFIRGKKVVLDSDLAVLYGVPTKRLNEQVRRNIERFPSDFMFQLTSEEEKQLIWKSQIAASSNKVGLDKTESSRYQFGTLNNDLSRSQFATLKRGQNIKYLPYAFTEQGVAMLSSVLKSKQAILVNIQIMRTFTKIREMLASNKELREKIEELERKYDQQFVEVFRAIKLLLSPPTEPSGEIGFRTKE